MQDYIKRIILPINPIEDIVFYTLSNLLIANGYTRVVIGGRGPYIEFDKKQIIIDNFYYVHYPKHVYYQEFRSKCLSNTKLYYQEKLVNYADYKIGKLYISPFELTSDKYPILITKLDRRNKKI